MKTVILGNMMDGQTGIYILNSFRKFTSEVCGIDTRRIIYTVGMDKGQEIVMSELNDLSYIPELIMIMKGTELTHETIIKIKEKYKDAILVNWFFDKFYTSLPIWEDAEYLKTLELFDCFFCSLKGVADKLNEMGYENVKYVDEGCYPKAHSTPHYNYYQEKQYGSEISFIGSIGFMSQHSNRIPLLERLIEEGYDIKIWGSMVGKEKLIPHVIRMFHTKVPVINEQHSIVVNSSSINIGIDQDVDVDMGHSARLYRVLCAGGLYLNTATKGLDKLFKINKEGKEITGKEDLVVFYDEEDLVKKIDFLLEHEDIRKQIAENGKKVVLDKHKFSDRISEMLEIIKNKDEVK